MPSVPNPPLPTLTATPRHEMLHYPFPTEHGLAWVILPREGISPADAQRMVEMVKTVVVEEASCRP